MITERGDVKVLDFGLAKLTVESDVSETDETRTQQAVTDEGSVVGSAPYMSPEQAEGRKVDPRSDIFAFGSLLYEMLTGKRAFHGKNRMATIASILKDEPEPVSQLVPEIPREVDRLVTRCLRKELDRRSQSMAEIRVAIEDLKEESESGSLAAPVTMVARRRRRWPSYALAGILIAAATAAFWMFGRGRQASPFQATVLTSFVGRHGEPSLSPDGNQFAFTWDGDVPQARTHVYISLVGKGTPLRLTPESEAAWGPSWSPDGQSIAYLRRQTPGQKPELHVMPALGGASRKIASGQISSASWSPDAKWLLWSEREESESSSIHASRAGGGDAYKLLDQASRGGAGIGDFGPAVSPDGRKVVLSRCVDDYDCDLYLAAFQDGRLTAPPVQLTHDHNRKSNPRWTNGGKEIVYMLGNADSELSMGRVRASGGEPLRIDGIGTNATSLTFAAKGNRLLYSTVSINFDMRRVDLTAADAKPVRFLSSTRYEGSPSYSPDGKRIAFSSNRGGAREIWIADADGSNAAPLTSFSDGVAGSPKWSPDGQNIAFDARSGGNADVYTMPAGGGAVKRLTDSPGQDHQPTWSPDGKWIYFGSTRAGGHEIFRMRPDGSGVRQITHNDGYYGLISPDGKWLYYSVPLKGLWKMPAEGGEATQALARPSLLGYYDFVVTSRGICAVGVRQPEGWPVVLYPFDGGKPRTLTTLGSNPQMFPELSPDGRWFLYTSADSPVFEIMLVDNFR